MSDETFRLVVPAIAIGVFLVLATLDYFLTVRKKPVGDVLGTDFKPIRRAILRLPTEVGHASNQENPLNHKQPAQNRTDERKPANGVTTHLRIALF